MFKSPNECAVFAAKQVGLSISRQALNTVDQVVHGIAGDWEMLSFEYLTLQAERMAQDLEAFAKHRKGSKSQGQIQHFKINIDDVKMLDRSHDELVSFFLHCFGTEWYVSDEETRRLLRILRK